nr:VanZ family protein [Streptomyces himastatinicus]
MKGTKSTKSAPTKSAASTKSAAKGKTGASKPTGAKSAGAKTPPAKTPPAKKKPSGTATTKKPGTAQKAAKAVAAKAAAPASPPLQRDSLGSRAGRVLVLLLAFACMVGFAAALAKATLVPQPGSSDLVHTNLHPGDSLRAYLDQPAIRDSVKQIGGNVLLGAPFGVLLPMLVPKARGAVRVVLVTSLVMVLVEIAQGAIVEGRAFDIDDVILNTSGALLGYVLIGRRLGHALHPRRRHWWQRRSPSA